MLGVLCAFVCVISAGTLCIFHNKPGLSSVNLTVDNLPGLAYTSFQDLRLGARLNGK